MKLKAHKRVYTNTHSSFSTLLTSKDRYTEQASKHEVSVPPL